MATGILIKLPNNRFAIDTPRKQYHLTKEWENTALRILKQHEQTHVRFEIRDTPAQENHGEPWTLHKIEGISTAAYLATSDITCLYRAAKAFSLS